MLVLRWINDADDNWIDESADMEIKCLRDGTDALTADLRDDHCEILPPPRPRVQSLHHHEPRDNNLQVCQLGAEKRHSNQRDPCQGVEGELCRTMIDSLLQDTAKVAAR